MFVGTSMPADLSGPAVGGVPGRRRPGPMARQL